MFRTRWFWDRAISGGKKEKHEQLAELPKCKYSGWIIFTLHNLGVKKEPSLLDTPWYLPFDKKTSMSTKGGSVISTLSLIMCTLLGAQTGDLSCGDISYSQVHQGQTLLLVRMKIKGKQGIVTVPWLFSALKSQGLSLVWTTKGWLTEVPRQPYQTSIQTITNVPIHLHNLQMAKCIIQWSPREGLHLFKGL